MHFVIIKHLALPALDDVYLFVLRDQRTLYEQAQRGYETDELSAFLDRVGATVPLHMVHYDC